MAATEQGNTARQAIVVKFAEWTALSALRSGAPIKSRKDVYSALAKVEFDPLFDGSLGPISSTAFNKWHDQAVQALQLADKRLEAVGWAAKIINVYLKTRAYVGGEGRPGLDEAIHPPIDSGLWKGLKERFSDRPDILAESNCVEQIKLISDYDCYRRIVAGCRLAATALRCKLIEVEQLWKGTDY